MVYVLDIIPSKIEWILFEFKYYCIVLGSRLSIRVDGKPFHRELSSHHLFLALPRVLVDTNRGKRSWTYVSFDFARWYDILFDKG
jgi:hypothetical protein